MNNQSIPLSLPTRQPARTDSLSIRLSADERAAVDALAGKLHVPTSHMARHFLLQAVTHYIQRMQIAVPLNGETPQPQE
jgi:hypothetical protein